MSDQTVVADISDVVDDGGIYLLVAATFATEDEAKAAYEQLKKAKHDGLIKIRADMRVYRKENGKLVLRERGDHTTARGAAVGASAGLVVALFSPPLFAAVATGAAIGGVIGAVKKHHEHNEEKQELDEFVPAGGAAVVAIVEDTTDEKILKALDKAEKTITKEIDKQEAYELERQMKDSGVEVAEGVGEDDA
jgi:uncharacterized membrane protein